MFGEIAATGAIARREKARREMHAAIMDVASRLLRERGLEAITIRGIANELGYSPGAIYEYYESKEDILKHVFFDGAGGLAEVMANAVAKAGSDASASDTVLTIARSYREAARANPEMFRLVMGAIKCPPAELVVGRAEDLPSSLTMIADALQRGIDTGEFRPMDPIAALASAWSLVQGFVSLELTGHLDVVDLTMLRFGNVTPIDRDTVYEQVLQTMLHGMLA